MKKLTVMLSVSVLLLFSSAELKANTDTTAINLNATFIDYINFIGTAVGASVFYTVDEIKPLGNSKRGPRVDVGTLGLKSCSVGDCEVEFTTQNNFMIRHMVTNQRLTRYRLRWKNKNITRKRNRQMTLPCSTKATRLRLQAVGNFRTNTQSGIYQNIIRMTVTTQ